MSDEQRPRQVCPSCQHPMDTLDTECPSCGYTLRAICGDPIGHTVGNLTIVELIAAGGMGTVYRAEHSSLGTTYAIKILHPRFSTDPTLVERFRREAVACSKLRHPSVVFVTDFGFHQELGIYLIMEHLQGAPLSQVLAEAPRMPLDRVLRIGRQVAEALGAAHELGIIHRDLKPENIFVCTAGGGRDHTKVLDFGIAQLHEAPDKDKLTRAGFMLGTPAYISPEQINSEGKQLGPATDVYALGVILHEAISGQVPFAGASEFEVMSGHMFKPPPPLSEQRPELAGSALEALLVEMMAKLPAHRPDSMDQVKQRLEQAVQELLLQGVEQRFYQHSDGQQGPTDRPVQLTPAPMRITNVISLIKSEAPESAAARLLSAFPGLAALQEEIFQLAMWGVLQRELLDHPLESDDFRVAKEQLRLMVEATLNAADERRDAFDLARVMRSLQDTLALADEPRQKQIAIALLDVQRHHLFPLEILPSWAQPRTTGTWHTFKRVATMELKLPFGRAGEPEDEALEDGDYGGSMEPEIRDVPDEPLTLNFTSPGGPAPDLSKHGDLSEKLKREVSIDAIKSALSHEIKFFGGDKDKKK